jgi:hypothetical protein
MVVLSLRHGGYKAGMFTLLPGLVLLLVGFSVPSWSHLRYVFSDHVTHVDSGLWMKCSTDDGCIAFLSPTSSLPVPG